MTTPEEPRRGEPAQPEQPPAQPEQPPAEQPASEQPEQPAQAEQPPQPAASAPPPPPAAAPPPTYQDPFAPVPRPPRTPWIAPQRKVAVAGIAVAGALVFIGAGVGIGAAAFGSDDRHGPVKRFDRPGPYDGQGPVFPGYPGYPKFPNGPRHLPQQSATPTPSPSSTS